MAKTISYQELSDGTRVPCRSVYVRELDEDVLVTTDKVLDDHIATPSADDEMFYCYAPVQEFENLSDKDFENYVNKNF